VRHERRILIVDDDDAIRALLHTVLRRRGLTSDTARNGIEALEKLAENVYALVLLDLMMPQMSGYEVLEQMATFSTRPLVLVLTAGLEPRPIDTSLVVGTIHKPFDVELLVDTISACIKTVDAQSQPIPPGAPQRKEKAN
jgi:DNA-binding response OmpR family regulator